MDASFEQDEFLADGRPIRLRWIRPPDARLIREGFERLSMESRYTRFFSPLKRLPDEFVRYLTHVDGIDHCAVVAVEVTRDGVERGLGVARFVRTPEQPSGAEVAVTVADDVQGYGIGPRLLSILAEAASERGIEFFAAAVLPENGRARRLLQKVHAVRVQSGGGVANYRLSTARLLAGRTARAA